MAAIPAFHPYSNPNLTRTSFMPSLRPELFSSFSLNSTFSSSEKSSSYSASASKNRVDRIGAIRCSALNSSSESHSFDVVIIGAGIIGLTIARQFLIGSNLSVAVVDMAVPCSGATGAGQGYLWMTHKTPESDIWELSMRSHKLWKMLAVSIQDQGMNPLEVLGWKKTGSLLVSRTSKESAMLRSRVKQLSQAGLRADYLSSSDLLLKEPAIMVGKEGGASFLPDDCQLDAQQTVSYIEKVNRYFASEGRYAEFYNHPVTRLIRSTGNGEFEAVQTSKNILYGKKAIVVAAGCWSGSLMHDLIRESDIVLDVPVKPRKGHLLVLENFNPFDLNHGLMEVGYANHEVLTPSSAVSSPGQVDHDQTLSVSMTATMDPKGNLLLGSSRQLAGFSTEVDESIIDRIWDRAGEFFPAIRELCIKDFSNSRKVRVGLRPYMPDGKPVIGPIPGLSKMFLATGHEGGGLSMALGTAEMVADMVLGNPGAREFVRISRHSDHDDLHNSAIGRFGSGALLGCLQGGQKGAIRYSIAFADAGTAVNFASL